MHSSEVRHWLWREWVKQLYREYDHILYSYRVALIRPVITIADWDGRWGAWDPMTRTLTLAARLIENYPWGAVQEILKHEIAHQIVSDEYGSDEAHGPLFRLACARLGMAPWACRAEAEIEVPQGSGREPSGEEARLLKRVEKLLALATSSNEHEALAAMEKVQELYAKYNLEHGGAARGGGEASDYGYTIISTGKKRVARHHMLICSILNEHFFVKVIHASQYDARDLGEYKVIELLGRPESHYPTVSFFPRPRTPW